LFLTGALYWNTFAIPYFVLLGVLAGFNSVYLTRSVIYFKNIFSKPEHEKMKVFVSAAIIGIALFIFPSLFGEGYHTIKELLNDNASSVSVHSVLFSLLLVLLLKPIITSVTLSGGGDGGIFAPSLFIGAILGLIVSTILNHFFDIHVIPLNFILVGMGAVLSSSIHAPFTSMFLICGLVGNYTLFIPLLITCMVSKVVSKRILPYTVYSYSGK
jgi:CIC family chloride channel protein